MNKANINKLIDHLKTQTEIGFNMAAFISFGYANLVDSSPNECGTTACLAGHIYMLNHPGALKQLKKGALVVHTTFRRVGAEFLGLSVEEADELFLYQVDRPDPAGCPMSSITISQAIRCLEILRDTGEVNWEEAVK